MARKLPFARFRFCVNTKEIIMLQDQGSKLYRWFSFLTLAVVVALTLQCCGRVTRGGNTPLEIELALPQGEDPSLFWLGVQTRVLRWKPQKGEPREMSWEAGAKNQWELEEGDRIEFLGTDSQGRLVVSGEVTVGAEKKATIPLRRVL